MLQRVVEHEAYHSGDTTTNFVEKYLQENKKIVMK
jgi:acetyl-CoA carboxylase, biotin carboxylase subunit